MLNLLDYITESAKMVGMASATTRVPVWLWAVENEILNRHPFWFMVKSNTLTMVDGTATYILDERCDGRRVSKMSDETNDAHVDLTTLANILWSDPTPTEEGDPYAFAYEGMSRVLAQPAAAGTLSIASSSAADVSKYITIRGRVSGLTKTEDKATDAADGTAAVTTTNSWDIGGLELIVKQGVTTGTITITRGAVTVASLAPKVLYHEAPIIRMKDVPGAAATMRYYFYQKVRQLTSNYEPPYLPEQFQWSIGMNGVMMVAHAAMKDFEQSRFYEQKMEKGYQQLIDWCKPVGGLTTKTAPAVKIMESLRYNYDQNDSFGIP